MKPFECVDADGQIHLHHDNWHRWKNDTLSSHNGEGKWRFDLDLRNPRYTLEEVPVSNLQVHTRFSPHTCFYECSDWSTIYDFYESDREPMFRMIVESQNPEPLWGERITLLSSSSSFKPEPWGRNAPNQFAFFRGMYWQVASSELLHHEYPLGVGYPLHDNGNFGIPRRGVSEEYRAALIANQAAINNMYIGLIPYTFNDLVESPNNNFYVPYIPLAQNDEGVNMIQHDEAIGLLTRYGRRLLEEGRRYYGRLRIVRQPKRYTKNKVDWRQEGF